MVLETHIKLYMTDSLERVCHVQSKTFWKNLVWTKNGQKTEFFEFVEKFCH